MVLRFRTCEPEPRYLAFCSERKIWTTKAPPKADYDPPLSPIEISAVDYEKIMAEIDFNCYGYQENF